MPLIQKCGGDDHSCTRSRAFLFYGKCRTGLDAADVDEGITTYKATPGVDMNSLCVLMNSCAWVESIVVPGREFLNEANSRRHYRNYYQGLASKEKKQGE